MTSSRGIPRGFPPIPLKNMWQPELCWDMGENAPRGANSFTADEVRYIILKSDLGEGESDSESDFWSDFDDD